MKRLGTTLKVYGLTLRRIVTQSILKYRMKGGIPKFTTTPVNLQREYSNLQHEFFEIFAKYDECARCVEHCCHSQINRFDFVDCYFNEAPLCRGESPWHSANHLRQSMAELVRHHLPLHKEKPPEESCVHLVPGEGCILPVGQRPGMCVAGVCSKLLHALSRSDLKRYSRLLDRYVALRRQGTGELSRLLSKSLEVEPRKEIDNVHSPGSD